MSDDIVAKVTRGFIDNPLKATGDAEQLVKLADPRLYCSTYAALREQDADEELIEYALFHSPKHANLAHVRAVAQRPAATGFLLVYTALLEEIAFQQERYGSAVTMPLIRDDLRIGDLEEEVRKAMLAMQKRDPGLYDSAVLLQDYFACNTMFGSGLAYALLLESMKSPPPASGGHH